MEYKNQINNRDIFEIFKKFRKYFNFDMVNSKSFHFKIPVYRIIDGKIIGTLHLSCFKLKVTITLHYNEKKYKTEMLCKTFYDILNNFDNNPLKLLEFIFKQTCDENNINELMIILQYESICNNKRCL